MTLKVSNVTQPASDEMILTMDNSAAHAAPSGARTYGVGAAVTLSGEVSDFDGDQLAYARDASGNISTTDLSVIMPHDQGK
jgi:hypothetical protein